MCKAFSISTINSCRLIPDKGILSCSAYNKAIATERECWRFNLATCSIHLRLNLLAGFYDGIADHRVQNAKLRIGCRSGHFNVGDGVDVLRIVEHLGCGNLVIVQCPLGLYAIVGICWNLKFAEEVAFDPEFLL